MPSSVTKATLVNNAGTLGDLSHSVKDLSLNEIREYSDLNIVSSTFLWSLFLLSPFPFFLFENLSSSYLLFFDLFAILEYWVSISFCFSSRFLKHFGHLGSSCFLVNISSLLAVQAFPYWSLYGAGKAARDHLIQTIAKENVPFPFAFPFPFFFFFFFFFQTQKWKK